MFVGDRYAALMNEMIIANMSKYVSKGITIYEIDYRLIIKQKNFANRTIFMVSKNVGKPFTREIMFV